MKIEDDKEALEVESINSIIPEGWHILELIKGEPVIAEGDLNKDSIPDIATVIEKITINCIWR
ncbi:hypothetical protein [Paenibacillus sp. BAC0078]